jgi:hypothetical protein
VPDQHPPALADHAAAELGNQPALAGAGVATEQDRTVRDVGRAHELREGVQLFDSTDQRGRRVLGWHAPIMVADDDGSY